MTLRLRSWLLISALVLAGCSITRHIEPVPPGRLLSVCIEENDLVWNKNFLPMLRSAFERRGIATTVYQGARPPECRDHVEYTAMLSFVLEHAPE